MQPAQSAIAEKLYGVDLLSLDDFDDRHLSGANLNDITYLTFQSWFKFINNGYSFGDNVIGNGIYRRSDDSFTPIDNPSLTDLTTYHVRLDDVNAFPLSLINNINIAVGFAKDPAKKGTYSFRLSMRFEKTTLTKDFSMIWD